MTNDIPRMSEDEAVARKVIEMEPDSAVAYYNLGFLLAQDSARINEAETTYRKAILLWKAEPEETPSPEKIISQMDQV